MMISRPSPDSLLLSLEFVFVTFYHIKTSLGAGLDGRARDRHSMAIYLANHHIGDGGCGLFPLASTRVDPRGGATVRP
jgi:hypothetical protein